MQDIIGIMLSGLELFQGDILSSVQEISRFLTIMSTYCPST